MRIIVDDNLSSDDDRIQTMCNLNTSFHAHLCLSDCGKVWIAPFRPNSHDPDARTMIMLPHGLDPDLVLAEAEYLGTALNILLLKFLDEDELERRRLSLDMFDEIALDISERLRSNTTFVTPDEWFEGDNIPVDADTRDAEIRAIAIKIRKDAMAHGMNGYDRALIDVDDFIEYLQDYRGEI